MLVNILILILLLLLFSIIFRNKESLIITNQEKNCFEDKFDMLVCICIPERKSHMKYLFKKWGFKKIIFYNAYLKHKYSHKFFIKKGFLDPNYSDYLNRGRICCHYSSMEVYKKFLKSKAKTLCVFEDDLSIDTYKSVSDFNLTMKPVLETIPKDWDYLNFSKCHDECHKSKPINHYWNKPNRPLCRTAIAMNKNAAKIIVEKGYPMINAPGDRIISDLIQNNEFKAYATNRLYFYQNRVRFGSNLGNIVRRKYYKSGNPPMCNRMSLSNLMIW